MKPGAGCDGRGGRATGSPLTCSSAKLHLETPDGGSGGGVRVEVGGRVVLYLGVRRGSPEAPLLGSV